MKSLTIFFLRLFGWKLVDNIDRSITKGVCIGAPHTSNWDFVLTIPGLIALDVKFRYLIKKEWFFFPMSLLFRLTGGIPVDRSKKNNLTEDLKHMLAKSDRLFIVFPPEGTRKRVKRWKTGFYHTAIDTNLPIIMGFIDYKEKTLGFGDVLYPSGDLKADFQKFEKFYSNITAENPECFNPQFYLREEGES